MAMVLLCSMRLGHLGEAQRKPASTPALMTEHRGGRGAIVRFKSSQLRTFWTT